MPSVSLSTRNFTRIFKQILNSLNSRMSTSCKFLPCQFYYISIICCCFSITSNSPYTEYNTFHYDIISYFPFFLNFRILHFLIHLYYANTNRRVFFWKTINVMKLAMLWTHTHTQTQINYYI